MNKDFEWDEPTSSDTKMDPAEVLQLEREFQEHGGRGVDNLVKVLDGTNDTSIPETYNKTMPVISQSLIKELLYKGTERDYCPQRFYHLYIKKDVQRTPSQSMLDGRYGETMLLGSCSRGESLFDLPRNTKNGEKKIDQQRIDIQIDRAKLTMFKHGINIHPDLNCQIKLRKIINGVLCEGELDIAPVFMINIDSVNPDKIVIAIVDVKFTANVDSTFGVNGTPGWGDYVNMDHEQPKMYHELVRDIDWNLNDHLTNEQIELLSSIQGKEIMFFYWVFDYKVPVDKLQDKFFGYSYDATKRAELYEDIRKVVGIIEFHNANDDWDRCVQNNECSKCPVLDCIFKNQIQTA